MANAFSVSENEPSATHEKAADPDYVFGYEELRHQYSLKIAKLVRELVGPIDSLVDLGGGLGIWAAAFEKVGVSQYTVYDHPDIPNEKLAISPEHFERVDLSKTIPEPKTATLAMSIECAEHLPAEKAREVVYFLTQSSPIVLFSAAIPWQGGIGHINEQPHYYWQSLFAQLDYEMKDVLRGKIAQDLDIPFFLRQNLFLFIRKDYEHSLHRAPDFLPEDMALVHVPTLKTYLERSLDTREILAALPQALRRSIARKFGLGEE